MDWKLISAFAALLMLFGCFMRPPTPPGIELPTATPPPATQTPGGGGAPTATPAPQLAHGSTNCMYAPSSCTFSPGFACASYQLRSGNTLALSFGQATGDSAIRIIGVACTKQQLSASQIPALAQPVEIPNGESRQVSGGSSGNEVRCTNENGVEYAGVTGECLLGGKLYVKYADVSTGTETVATGDISARWE